jgi:hypothetical protein
MTQQGNDRKDQKGQKDSGNQEHLRPQDAPKVNDVNEVNEDESNGLSAEKMAAIADLAASSPHAHQNQFQIYRSLPQSEKRDYFVHHFLIWIVTAVVIIAVASSLIHAYATKPPQPDLQVQAVNLPGEGSSVQSAMDQIGKAYRKATSLDEQHAVFRANMYYPTAAQQTSQKPTDSDAMKIFTMVSAGDINAVIAPADTVKALANAGMITPVDHVVTPTQYSRLSHLTGSFVKGTMPDPDNPKKRINTTMGISLSSSPQWQKVAPQRSRSAVLAFANVSQTRVRARQLVDVLIH